MKSIIVFLAMVMTVAGFSADPTFSLKEASDVPLAGFVEMTYKGDQKTYVGPDSGITAANIASIRLHDFAGESALCIVLDPAGTQLNQAFTARLLGKRTVMIIDGRIISLAKIMAPSGAEFCTTGPTRQEMERIVAAFGKR